MLQAEAALKACDGSLERAADWLFSRGDTLDADVAAVLNPAAAPAASAAAAPGQSHFYLWKLERKHLSSNRCRKCHADSNVVSLSDVSTHA